MAGAAAESRNLSSPREVGGRAMASLTEAIRGRVRELFLAGDGMHADCRAKLLQADDESYMHDRKPWPQGAICNRSS